ncbi:NgoMIV family type II restriction endonuclease [Mycolicibacterium arseniciresistens]|uniref:NgoMIV family type II restriction endonuclease n=1 Tax=Mycolicibacterium arseniciresistens TaxID=3062257 RepID=A0ABT8U9I7_9MYCO|nr:NgoMIV family type II restriction endonuclease [Mycolicibacterium arseniciresistens]MDO3634461.1 NgoMIV family type II restriction endonuclease [Mycolicibacterium arseniciresistens]
MADAPAWIEQLLGWKPATQKSQKGCEALFGAAVAPNLADMSSRASMHLAGYAYETLDIPQSRVRTQNLDDDSAASGTALERAIENDLKQELQARDPDRTWLVTRTGTVADYAQYTHLNELQALLDQSPALRSTFAGDYQVKTDVYVGVENSAVSGVEPYLHAAISSKWTIRSDRVQNVRHEFGMLVKNRRGRAPHLVLVTGEPLPSRLLSIARGTGEIDAVYHLMYDELDMAVSVLCGDGGLYPDQRGAWVEMAKQKRLKPYSSLVDDLLLS